MAVSSGLRRLLRIRELEEELSQSALAAALGEMNRLRKARTITEERGREGRELVHQSADSAQCSDRVAGIEEERNARRVCAALAEFLEQAEAEVMERREEYLLRHMERSQAATLLEGAAREEAALAARRAQQHLDEWFQTRKGCAIDVRSAMKSASPANSERENRE